MRIECPKCAIGHICFLYWIDISEKFELIYSNRATFLYIELNLPYILIVSVRSSSPHQNLQRCIYCAPWSGKYWVHSSKPQIWTELSSLPHWPRSSTRDPGAGGISCRFSAHGPALHQTTPAVRPVPLHRIPVINKRCL